MSACNAGRVKRSAYTAQWPHVVAGLVAGPADFSPRRILPRSIAKSARPATRPTTAIREIKVTLTFTVPPRYAGAFN